MKRLFTICLVLLLCASSFATKVKDTSEKLGSFTGPVSGAAQDDNVKASLDLLHALIGPDRIKGTGSIFYVDSGVASTAGTSWATAVGTIDAGVNLCTADRGDIILVAAGHAANLAGADAVDVDLGGITIIGLGVGENRPVLSFTNLAGEFVIGADDVAVYNIEFLAHTPDVAHAIEVLANMENLIVDGCRFSVHTTGTDEFTDAIETADGADNMQITNCVFEQGAGAADTAISLVGADYADIYNNRCYGDYAVACIESLTTASIHITIRDNILFNGTVGGNAGLNTVPTITMKTDTTGVIINNHSFCNVVSPEDAIVAADMYCAGNTYSENEQAGGSELIGRSQGTDILAALGVSTTDGTTRGRVVYCDSGETTSVEDGLTWATATDTLDEAINLCTANNGDTIFVAPGHAETATVTTADIDVAGVTIIGLGNGNLRPTITYDGATDTVTFGATGDNCSIHNFRFVSSVTAVASAIVVEDGCTDFIIENCEFSAKATTVDEFIDTIKIHGTASNRGIVRYNRFLGDVGANAGPKSSINFEDAHFLQIYGNEFSGDIGDAHIFNETTASNYITIRDNRILNGYIGGNLDVTPCISLYATTTGWIANNTCVTNVATPDLAIVAADCYLAGNTYTETQGAVGNEDIGTVAGRTYTSTMTATSTNDTLFDVAGGAIFITSFVGVVTTPIGAVANTIAIDLNADSGWIDSDFSTAVETNADVAGTRYFFSNAIESVLTPVSDTTGNTSIMNGWYCGEGMIEQSASGATTGAIKWYMTWIPYDNGTTVTPQ